MADQVSSLIVRLIDQVTGPAKAIGNAIKGIGQAVKNSSGGARMEKLDAALARTHRRIDGARMQLADAVVQFYALKKAIGAPVTAARNFEAAFADVKKVTEFDATGPYSAEAFRKSLVNLSRRVPLTVEELSAIAAAAGQAGIALSDMEDFTANVAYVATAFEISTKDAGDALAHIKGALALSNPEVMLLADHMNVLANAMATSERQTLDVVNRVGALGAVVGVAPKHIAALGAAMTSAGADAESAGTALRNVFLNLAQGEGMGKREAGAMLDLGLDPRTFPKRMQTEGIAAIVDLFERIQKLPKEKRAATLTDLFDKRAVDALGPMMNNLDLLRQALGLIEDDQKNAGAALREFEKRNDTFDARVKMMENNIRAFQIALGDALIPALTAVMERLNPIIKAFGEWIEKNPKLAATIAGLVAGLVGFNIAMIGVKYFGNYGYLAFLTLAKGVGTLSGAFTTLSGAIAATGIGAIVIGIALAGIWIYNNWSGIAAMFDEFGTAFRNALGPEAAAVLDTIISGISTLWGWVSELLGPINQTEEGWRAWGRAAGEAAASVVNAITNLPETVSAMWRNFSMDAWAAIAEMKYKVKSALESFVQDMNATLLEWEATGAAIGTMIVDGIKSAFSATMTWFSETGSAIGTLIVEGIKAAFDDLMAWFASLPSRIVAAIGRIDLSGILKWPSMPSWLGGGGGKAAPVTDGKKAAGGPVARGNSYLVGERGPEIFKPATSGTIIPNKALAGGGSTTIAPTFNISINGNADATTVENIRRVLRDEVRQAFRGVYADAGMRFA